jgi:dCMP deaminase
MNWDTYFLGICNAVAEKSPCLSRKIGAIITRDNSVLSTGYNGPPRGVPHCPGPECPRRSMGFHSGEGMECCPAQHGEENAVSNAARCGTNINNTILYLNTVIPCSKCYGTLINAGIVEIVALSLTVYDKHTQFLIDSSKIKLRTFSA